MDLYPCATDLSASVALNRNIYSLSVTRILRNSPIYLTRTANSNTHLSPSRRRTLHYIRVLGEAHVCVSKKVEAECGD